MLDTSDSDDMTLASRTPPPLARRTPPPIDLTQIRLRFQHRIPIPLFDSSDDAGPPPLLDSSDDSSDDDESIGRQRALEGALFRQSLSQPPGLAKLKPYFTQKRALST